MNDNELKRFKTYLISGVIKKMSLDYDWSFDQAVEKFKASKTYKLIDSINDDTFDHESPELFYDYWKNEQKLGYPIDSASLYFARKNNQRNKDNIKIEVISS